jgi:UDP-N-acetylglucosamine:LPS N-acetylglucosamine transferase
MQVGATIESSATMAARRPKVLAVSSGGGHWVQLVRLSPAFVDSEVIFATVRPGYRADVTGAAFRVIPDANRWSKLGLLKTALGVGWLLLRERPDVVISTGAAPGFFAIVLGRWFGARTIWVDSVANAEELSLSGQKAGRFAHLWLTQWPHLAKEGGPQYFGNVL